MTFPWWGWVLIAIAVGVIGFLKLKVWKTMTKKPTSKNQKDED